VSSRISWLVWVISGCSVFKVSLPIALPGRLSKIAIFIPGVEPPLGVIGSWIHMVSGTGVVAILLSMMGFFIGSSSGSGLVSGIMTSISGVVPGIVVLLVTMASASGVVTGIIVSASSVEIFFSVDLFIRGSVRGSVHLAFRESSVGIVWSKSVSRLSVILIPGLLSVPAVIVGIKSPQGSWGSETIGGVYS